LKLLCSEPDGTAGRVVPRLMLDGGRTGGKWMIQTKNQQELQVRRAALQRHFNATRAHRLYFCTGLADHLRVGRSCQGITRLRFTASGAGLGSYTIVVTALVP
jgi:hypothetical protein